MSIFRSSALYMAVILILAGCSSGPKPAQPIVLDKPAVSDKPKDLNPGVLLYSAGITNYEDGNYALCEKNLKGALDLGLADLGDQVTAHKYLAFLYCISSRKTLCRKEFKIIFELDPGFTLSPAEEGHPMWRKIYRQVKKQMTPVKKTP